MIWFGLCVVIVVIVFLVWALSCSYNDSHILSLELEKRAYAGLPSRIYDPFPKYVECPQCDAQAPQTHRPYFTVIYTCPTCKKGYVYRQVGFKPTSSYSLLTYEPFCTPQGEVVVDGGRVADEEISFSRGPYWIEKPKLLDDPDEHWSQGVWEYVRCRADCRTVPGHARLAA